MGIMRRSCIKSPWLFHLNTGSCNGCDIEILATLTPRYDAERLGCILVGSPRHADALIVTGFVSRQMLPRMIRVYRQIPEPKVVVAVGSCAISGGTFVGSYVMEGPVDRIVPVDAYVPGCPPRPEAIIKGLVMALNRKFKGQVK